jgi:hypothetical protein
MPDNDPEGPPNENAKDEAAKVLKDPKHKRDKGDPADERTRDDPQKGEQDA